MLRPDERSDARERALYLLYEAHSKGIDPADTIDLQVVEPDSLTQELVTGVGRDVERLDVLIAAKAKGWTLARMPVLDLSVMRLAVYELLDFMLDTCFVDELSHPTDPFGSTGNLGGGLLETGNPLDC